MRKPLLRYNSLNWWHWSKAQCEVPVGICFWVSMKYAGDLKKCNCSATVKLLWYAVESVNILKGSLQRVGCAPLRGSHPTFERPHVGFLILSSYVVFWLTYMICRFISGDYDGKTLIIFIFINVQKCANCAMILPPGGATYSWLLTPRGNRLFKKM